MKNASLSPDEHRLLNEFLLRFGSEGLIAALDYYTAQQEAYLVRTRTQVKKIPVGSIHYIRISSHSITVHTASGDYHKYGTLNQEYGLLRPKGFVKCSQNTLVPIRNIREINGSCIILCTGERIPVSRSCAAEVLTAYAAAAKETG